MTKPPALRDLMPEMTDREDEFVSHFVRLGDANEAAKLAGYAQPDVQGRAIARRPRIAAAIRIETTRRLQHMAPVALTVLDKVMQDEKAPAGARVDAAKTILDRAAYVSDPKRPGRSDGTDVPLAERSIQELERLVEQLEAQRAAQAVDITPVIRDDDEQALDPLE